MLPWLVIGLTAGGFIPPPPVPHVPSGGPPVRQIAVIEATLDLETPAPIIRIQGRMIAADVTGGLDVPILRLELSGDGQTTAAQITGSLNAGVPPWQIAARGRLVRPNGR